MLSSFPPAIRESGFPASFLLPKIVMMKVMCPVQQKRVIFFCNAGYICTTYTCFKLYRKILQTKEYIVLWQRIAQRSEVPVEFTWKLEDMYADAAAWEPT